METSSGGRGAVSSGSFSVGQPLTPLVYTQAGLGKGELASVAVPSEAAKVLAAPIAFSRLGSEVYGGQVTKLTGATVQSTGAQYGVFPKTSYNLANYINPSDVNKTKAELPTIVTPFQLGAKEGAEAPSLRLLTSVGYTPINVPSQIVKPITIETPTQATVGGTPMPAKLIGVIGPVGAATETPIMQNAIMSSGVGPAIADAFLSPLGLVGIKYTPGADYLNKVGLSGTIESATANRDLANLQAQKPTYDALSSTIDSQRAQLSSLTAGKINSEGKFTGSESEYKQIQTLKDSLIKYIDKYNS